ncbi:MAG: lamin tail domain-containing protein [Actinomycetota bacterium]
MGDGSVTSHRPPRAALTISAVVALLATLLSPSAGAQESPFVVINEVFYHPPCTDNLSPCTDAPAEFVELYNAGDETVDLAGWTFADGVEYTFIPGTVIAAGAYLVIADDLVGFNDFFSQTADGEWSGALSNSGERIALLDAGATIIDELTYSDGSNTPGAWSVGADGNGDSLSLLSADNDDGSSWWWDGADPTPGAVNANDGQSPSAIVDNFTWTVLPGANDPIDISADVFGGVNVAVQYRINYPGTTETIPMNTGGGTTWTAQIPASAYDAGDLVRFRILNDGNRVAPRQEDSIDWVGTTVADPTVNSNVPVMEWFTSDSNYNSGYNEGGDTLYDGVLAYDGQVWDNIGFRIRGQIARSADWSKRNWKFKFPDGHDFFIDGISYGLDSIDLQGGFADEARIREVVGHTVADQMGLVASQVQHVQLRRNGEFFGLHTLQEHPEGGFLQDNGLPNATLYKRVTLDYEQGPNVPGQTTIGYETWDIPEYINLLAAASVIQHNDYAHGNLYAWYDADEHQRFEAMIWDLDLSQGIRYPPDGGLTVALENGNTWSYVWNRWKRQAPLFQPVLASPFRELYLRRVRTLADEWFGTGRYEQVARAAFANITGANGGANLWALDTAEWGFWGGQNFTQQGAIDRHSDTWIDDFYEHLTDGGPDGDIPDPQPVDPNLELVVDPAPGDQRAERIEIRNNETVAIDISGWQISGSTTATLAPGAVLPAGGSAYLVFDDTLNGYRAVTNDHYVLGEYDAALNDTNGNVRLSDIGGVERAAAQWGDGAPSPGLILNEWNAVASTNLILNGDTRLGSVLGNGGDWFELVVTDDNLDIRGWRLDINDAGEFNQSLTFSDDDIWSDLRAGTIITISETPVIGEDGTIYGEDISYRPPLDDWWIHVVGGALGTGTYITATDFRVSKDNWQLSIHDATDTRRFGPAGEGIGSLEAGGVNNNQIGELEADPGPTITAGSPYGDGDESTFGEPNNFAGSPQDFDSIRPDVGVIGDVNCSAASDITDALLIAQYAVGLRGDAGACPLGDPVNEINGTTGDVDLDGQVTIVDALVISQCSVGIVNPYCAPDP